MVYIKIEMSMIKYYHEYILFKCYYSFKMVLGIFYCCLSEEVGVDVELLIHFFEYFNWCIGLLLSEFTLNSVPNRALYNLNDPSGVHISEAGASGISDIILDYVKSPVEGQYTN
jgi:hypothetical protein